MTIIDEAIIFAAKSHSGQKRKLGGMPYIFHAVEAAQIAAGLTHDESTVAAAALHDTVEDCGVTPDEIREAFGERVLELVMCETEDKKKERPPEETWKERKAESLEVLKNTSDREVKVIWLSDKLSNMRSFCREYKKSGEGLWSNFHQKDKAQHEWYYTAVENYLSELSDSDAYKEYSEILDYIFNRR